MCNCVTVWLCDWANCWGEWRRERHKPRPLLQISASTKHCLVKIDFQLSIRQRGDRERTPENLTELLGIVFECVGLDSAGCSSMIFRRLAFHQGVYDMGAHCSGGEVAWEFSPWPGVRNWRDWSRLIVKASYTGWPGVFVPLNHSVLQTSSIHYPFSEWLRLVSAQSDRGQYGPYGNAKLLHNQPQFAHFFCSALGFRYF